MVDNFKILFDRAIAIAGGSETKLAAAAGCSQNAIWHAKRAGRVSAKMAVRIETATKGEISRGLLRRYLWSLPSSPAATGEGDAGAASVDGPSRAAPADDLRLNSFDRQAFVHFVTTLWPVESVVEASFYFGIPQARLGPILDGSTEPSAEDRRRIESRLADVKADPCEVLRTGRAA